MAYLKFPAPQLNHSNLLGMQSGATQSQCQWLMTVAKTGHDLSFLCVIRYKNQKKKKFKLFQNKKELKLYLKSLRVVETETTRS